MRTFRSLRRTTPRPVRLRFVSGTRRHVLLGHAYWNGLPRKRQPDSGGAALAQWFLRAGAPPRSDTRTAGQAYSLGIGLGTVPRMARSGSGHERLRLTRRWSAPVLGAPRVAAMVGLRSRPLAPRVLAAAVISSIISLMVLAFGFDESSAKMHCASISVKPYGQEVRGKVRIAIYQGSLSCRSARRVIRYTLEHKGSASGLAAPRGWTCARGAPSQSVTATGVSCATRHKPLRIAEGLFPGS